MGGDGGGAPQPAGTPATLPCQGRTQGSPWPNCWAAIGYRPTGRRHYLPCLFMQLQSNCGLGARYSDSSCSAAATRRCLPSKQSRSWSLGNSDSKGSMWMATLRVVPPTGLSQWWQQWHRCRHSCYLLPTGWGYPCLPCAMAHSDRAPDTNPAHLAVLGNKLKVKHPCMA